ncbi:MAG TPA: oxalurate catabolism protein HpxZ [Halothiobacillus sp.]|nr:oxalurate catabolism protein HpxZ [Halothiobacillus sp.]
MREPDAINREDIVNEVRQVFEQYEHALVDNNIDVLDHFFWHTENVVRFGASESLYGIDAIRAFRRARPADALERDLVNTRINTFGADFAIATTEFVRPGQPVGRQTQVWVRFAHGWRIVSAHVSAMILPAPTSTPTPSATVESELHQDDRQSIGG